MPSSVYSCQESAERTKIFQHTILQTADLTQTSTSSKPEVLVQCGEKNQIQIGTINRGDV